MYVREREKARGVRVDHRSFFPQYHARGHGEGDADDFGDESLQTCHLAEGEKGK